MILVPDVGPLRLNGVAVRADRAGCFGRWLLAVALVPAEEGAVLFDDRWEGDADPEPESALAVADPVNSASPTPIASVIPLIHDAVLADLRACMR